MLKQESFEIIKQIGNRLFLAHEKESNKDVCIQYWPNSPFTDNDKRDLFIEKIKACNGPFCIDYLGYFSGKFADCENAFCIVTEYIPNGSLFDYIKESYEKHQSLVLSNTKKMILLYGILRSLNLIASHGMERGTLSTKNVFVNNEFVPKISNYYYPTPDNENDRSNVYSYGMIAFEILTGKSYETDFCSLYSSLPEQFQDLLEKCLSRERKTDFTLESVLELFEKGLILPDVNIIEYAQYISSIPPISVIAKEYKDIYDVGMYLFEKQMMFQSFNCFVISGVKLNNPLAKNQLGICYKKGYGVSKNYDLAYSNFLESSKEGYAEAHLNLGKCYMKGKGVARDFKTAVHYFSLSVDQDFPEAKCYLGICYFYGYGIRQDIEKAMDLISSAAEQGNKQAQKQLGILLVQGGGVRRDLDMAAHFMSLALEGEIEEMEMYESDSDDAKEEDSKKE